MQNNPSVEPQQEHAWRELWRLLLAPESLRLVEPPNDKQSEGGETSE